MDLEKQTLQDMIGAIQMQRNEALNALVMALAEIAALKRALAKNEASSKSDEVLGREFAQCPDTNCSAHDHAGKEGSGANRNQ
jgi:hypothetical protein